MRNCIPLKQYIDYWDEWHKEWFENLGTKTPKTTIKEWSIPVGIDKKGIEISNYFPEPYWGNPYPEKLLAVFLNLNPGGGVDLQNVSSNNIASSQLYESYKKNGNSYSKTVRDLIDDSTYITTNWFIRRRVNWLNQLIECLAGFPKTKATIHSILCADLVPWHTLTTSSISKYIRANYPIIVKYVIDPITEISQCAEMEGIVLAKGVEIDLIFSNHLKLIPVIYTNGNFRIMIYEYNNAKIIVCVGGQGMRLPNPDKVYIDSYGNQFTVCQIVEICLNHNN